MRGLFMAICYRQAGPGAQRILSGNGHILLRPAAKFRLDKAPPAPCVAGMSSPVKKPFSIVSLVIDLVLTGIAYVIFYLLVRSHVPSNDPKMVMLWGGLAAGCLSGVFWLAWQMLKVVFNFQRDSRK